MKEKCSVKEFKNFCKSYIFEKCEGDIINFTILTGHDIIGAAKSRDEDYYSSTIKGIAYIDNSNELIEKDIRFTYYLNNRKDKRKNLKFIDVKNLSVYRIKCKKVKDIKNLYYLLKIKKVKDKRFDIIIQEKSKPLTEVIDGVRFTYNRTFCVYEGILSFNDKKINVNLGVNCKNADASKSIKTYKKIKCDFKNFYSNVLKKCSKDIVSMANSWRSEDDNHVITTEEIAKRIDEHDISIEINDNNFSFYFDDDNIFCGHTIIYYGNINNEEFSVDIAG